MKKLAVFICFFTGIFFEIVSTIVFFIGSLTSKNFLNFLIFPVYLILVGIFVLLLGIFLMILDRGTENQEPPFMREKAKIT